MKKKHFNVVFLFCTLTTISLFIAGCGGGASPARPTAVVQAERPTAKTEKPERLFEGRNIMKEARIYSAGNYIFHLIDGSPETYFVGGSAGLTTSGKFSKLLIELGGEVRISGIVITNVVGIEVGKVGIYISKIFVNDTNFNTNFLVWDLKGVSGDVIEVEIKGKDIKIGEIEVYGEYVKKYEWSAKADKPYKLKKGEEVKVLMSSDELIKKNYDKAIELNLKLLEADPKNPYANMNLGQIYIEKSKMAEGEEEHTANVVEGIMRLENADIAENPKRKELLRYLASVYKTEMIGSPDKVTECYRKALEIEEEENPGKVTYSKVIGWKRLGDSLIQEGKKEEGRAYKEMVVKWIEKNEVRKNDETLSWELGSWINYYRPDTENKIKNLSEAEKMKRWEKVVETAKLQVEKFPDTEWVREGWSFHELALACMALGRWEEAIEAWKGVIINGKSVITEPAYNLSYCYIKKSEIEKAEIWYVYALSVELWFDNPNNIRNEIEKVYNTHKDIRFKVTTEVFAEKAFKSINDFLISKNKKNDNWKNNLAQRVSNYLKKYNVVVNP